MTQLRFPGFLTESPSLSKWVHRKPVQIVSQNYLPLPEKNALKKETSAAPEWAGREGLSRRVRPKGRMTCSRYEENHLENAIDECNSSC